MIGIIGGYGSIGFEAAKILKNLYGYEIMAAGRKPDSMGLVKQSFFQDIEVQALDISDYAEVRQLLERCGTVINCTGAALDIAALADGIKGSKVKYADISENVFAAKKLTNKVAAAVFAAGSLPGLSALMPRYLAGQMEKPEKLNFSYEARGSFTAAAAKEYLEGLFEQDKYLMVEWKRGRLEPVCGTVLQEEGFKADRQVFPYFDREAGYLTDTLRLEEGRWNMVIRGEYTLKMLTSARELYKENPREAVEALRKASALDLLYGGCSYVKMEAELEGGKETRRMTVKAGSPEKLTGAAAAITAHLLHENMLPEGAYTLGRCEKVMPVMEQLLSMDSLVEVIVSSEAGSGLAEIEEEGEI
ncbi:hypothetical protein LY28_00127 [Ruminiclostridium sufflavum DSM 19573]|uniref:Saccharopine dehydrogenase-like protein n=1 Tax=Ruminiclostridium sufflavum DSM 19573 TaxID=1121337 RepID=A0A318XRN2_9FIRM|nr:hypothetical protein [Ruminiclostridium sufflavum]PYG90247.1 hypothetical protein LY28_00127 [Ruminiclostridium sufflavum DSM 19573]